jgi:hypothetical protein
MTLLGFLNQWWNLPFLVELGLVVVFMGWQLLGLAASGADADVDGDADGHDADHDGADGASDAEGGDGALHGVLSFLGVGRVPFMMVWSPLFFFSGITGIFLNSLFMENAGEYRAWFFPVASVGALLVGLGVTGAFARVAGRFVDTGGKGAASLKDLVGKMGVVASPQLDQHFGEVRVRNQRGGDEILVHGRLQDGEATLKHGAPVVLVDLDAEQGMFWVAAVPDVANP